MWSPVRGRVCSLATLSLLSAACGGRVSTELAGSAAGAGNGTAGASGSAQGGSAQGGSAQGGSAGSVGSGGSGIILGSSGSAGADVDAGCPLDCSGTSQCNSCVLVSSLPGDFVAHCSLSIQVDPTQPGVLFDCSPLSLGDNGFTYDAQNLITLTGDACEALKTGAVHRIEVVLGCPLDR